MDDDDDDDDDDVDDADDDYADDADDADYADDDDEGHGAGRDGKELSQGLGRRRGRWLVGGPAVLSLHGRRRATGYRAADQILRLRLRPGVAGMRGAWFWKR